MPKLVSLYIRHALIGFGLAALFVAGLLWLNVANLWHLVTHSSAGPLAVLMLFLFNGIVFSGVQFGIAVMRMTEPENRGQGGARARSPQIRTAPVPVPVRTDRGEARPQRRFDDC